MKLYGYITSERSSKGQGGKRLSIKLSHETAYGSWEAIPRDINCIEIEMIWNEGKPFLTLRLPKTWKGDFNEADRESVFHAEYRPDFDDFTYPEKAKRQKGEKICKLCDNKVYGELNYCYEHRPNI